MFNSETDSAIGEKIGLLMYFYLCDYIQISNKAIGVLAHTCMHARMCVCVFESLIPILQARRLLILSFLKLYVL